MRALPLLALSLSACAEPTGHLVIRGWAEDAVPDGFAAEDTDGWAVTFDHWYTAFHNINLRDQDSGDELWSSGESLVADWKVITSPALLGATDVAAGRHDFGFRIGTPVAGTSNLVGGIPGSVASDMTTNGWSHLVIGSATNGVDTKTFQLGFGLDVSYESCENGYDGSAGVIVNKNDETFADIYVHADHLLWDQLGTEEASLAFQAWADADADADGAITQAELEAVDLATIGYEAAGIDVTNLWEFVSFSVAIMAHLNGEGECVARGFEE
jgi:hypothetical protein